MTLGALVNIVAPPKKPSDLGIGKGWAEVESYLNTELPSDYKEFINLYGLGLLSDSIWVYNPFSDKQSGQNLLVRISEVLSIWRHTRAEFGERECPYPLYPEPNGLLPWGHVDTGAELFWKTSGNPDQWTIVVNESRGPEFQEFEESMAGFLVGLFSGKLKSDILPRSLQRRRKMVSFIPLPEQ